MLKVFIGFDHRQPVSYTALVHSLLKHASKPLSITPLILSTLPVKRQGLTPFTYSRFLVPYLCGFSGTAVFMDSDMLVRSDICELEEYADCPVSVVKNPIRFEWSSLMVFDCFQCQILTPDYIEGSNDLHKMSWASSIGQLPSEFNHLVGYDTPRHDAKVVHFTQGVPLFPETRECEYAQEWLDTAKEAISAVTWQELMGGSVHAEPVMKRLANSTT